LHRGGRLANTFQDLAENHEAIVRQVFAQAMEADFR
jgi:hypothetical protein